MSKKIYTIVIAAILSTTLVGFGLFSFRQNGGENHGKQNSTVLRDNARTPWKPSSGETASLRPEAASPAKAGVKQAAAGATVFEGETKEVRVVATAAGGVFPEGTEMRVLPASADATMAAAQEFQESETEVVDAVAADITFYKDGIEIQPVGSVDVRLYAKREIGGEGHEAVTVGKDGTAEVVGLANASMSAFVTDHFTVYAIVGKTYGGRNMTRLARQVYRFYLNDELVSTQIVKNGDALFEPALPGGHSKKVFAGWYLGSASDPLTFGQALDIPATQTANDTFRVDARFRDMYKVTFYTAADRKTVFRTKEGAGGTVVSTGDVVMPDSTHLASTYKIFDGWKGVDGNIAGEDTTIAGTDVEFVPNFVKGNWVFFDSRGGSYVRDTLVKEGGKVTEPEAPTYEGHTFLGWEIFNAADNTYGDFDFGTAITNTTTLFAKWQANTSRYKLRIWRENADDEEYTLHDSLYLTGATGEEVPFDSLLNTILPKDKYEGFHLNGTALPTWRNNISNFTNQYDYHARYTIFDKYGYSIKDSTNAYLFHIDEQGDTIYEFDYYGDTVRTFSYWDAGAYIDDRAAFFMGPDIENNIGHAFVDTTGGDVKRHSSENDGDFTIHGDGSTVVNVFYSRDHYRFLFRFGSSKEVNDYGDITTYNPVTNCSNNEDNTSMYGPRRTRSDQYGRKIDGYHINTQQYDSLYDDAPYRYTDLYNTAMSVKHGENLYRAINGLNSNRRSSTDQWEVTKAKVSYFVDDRDWAWYAGWKEDPNLLNLWELTPRNQMSEINPGIGNQVLFDGNFLKSADGTPVYPHGSEVQMILRRIDDYNTSAEWQKNQFLHQYNYNYESLPAGVYGEETAVYNDNTPIHISPFNRTINGASHRFSRRYGKLVWGTYWYGETAWMNAPQNGFTTVEADQFKTGNPPLRLFPNPEEGATLSSGKLTVTSGEPQLWKFFSKDFEWATGISLNYLSWPEPPLNGDVKVSPPIRFYNLRNQYPVTFIDGETALVDSLFYYEQYLNLSEGNVPGLAGYPDSLHVVAQNRIKAMDGIIVKDGGKRITRSRNGVSYKFDGWYTDPQFEYPASYPTTMPYHELTYYAKWEPDSVAVTFHFENGEGDTTIMVKYDNACALPDAPVWEGHSFIRWEDANGIAFNENGTMLKDTNVYARWSTFFTYAVRYNAGTAGTFSTETDPCTYLEGANAATLGTAVPNNPADTVFSGWRIGNSSIILTKGLFAINSTNDEADTKDSVITLNAVYTPVPRPVTQITYHANYPTKSATDTTIAQDYIINDDYVINQDTNSLGFRMAGYKFFAWSPVASPNVYNPALDPDRVLYFTGDTIALEAEDNHLYAIWTPMMELTVSKVWNDNGNQDGKRVPVEVRLMANGDSIGVHTFGTEDNPTPWDTLLPTITESGLPIVYTIQELAVPEGYGAHYPDNFSDPTILTVTNTHIPDSMYVKVAKVWVDNNDQDGKRPTEVSVTLTANGTNVENGTATLSASNNWKHQWGKLPVYYNGTAITYNVTEATVEGYNSPDIVHTGLVNGVDSFTVTNTHTPETVSINATKVWIDSDSRSRKQVPVTFYQTTNATAAFDPTNVGTAWTTLKDTFFTVADTNTVSLTVAKYNSGKLLRYAFAETAPTGYHANPTGKLFATAVDATELYDTVRNIANTAAVATLMPVLKKISGRNWLETDSFLIVLHDPNNTNPMPANSINDGSYIYAPLLAINDSISIADTARLLRFGPITFYIGDLEGKSDSTFTYNLLESTPQQSGLPRPVGITYDSKMYKVSITVRAEGATQGSMSASVVCTPINDNTSLDTVSFVNVYDHESTTYYISGAKELHTRGVTKSLQDGDYTFTLKPAGSDIEKARTPMPSDCQGTGANRVSTTQNMGSNVKFNDIVFNHAQLLADGFTDGDLIQGVTFKYEVAEQIPADAQNLGTGVWLRKEVNSAGDTLEYYYDATIHYRVITVTLKEIPGEGAVLNVTGHVSNEMNEYWPTANGTHMLTQEEHARRHYNGAPQFHNVIIARTKVPVKKVWDDYDNFFGLRPSNVHVSLLANDITTGKELVLCNVNQWADTFKNLPSAILDPSTFTLTDINYTVSEPTATPVAANNNNLVEAVNYTPVTTGNATTGFTITNSIKNVEIDTTIAVRKVWAGGTPAGSSVTIQLYRNDSPLDSWTYLDDNDQSVTGSGTLTLSGDTWTGTFPHLPKFDENYVAYTYSIAETQIQTTDSKFYLAKITGNSANGYTVTNTPSPGLTKLVNGSNATMRLNDWSTPIPYSISTYIPVTDHLNGFVITDTLESVLDTASQPVIKINNVTINNNNVYTYNPATGLLTFDFGDYLSDAYQGQSVQITFNAKIRSTVTFADLESYLNTETNEPDVPNHARYTLTVDNKDTFRLSDTVFVTPTYIELLAKKIWVDQNDNDRHRPANITVNLYADYEDGAIATFTLDKNNPLNTTNIWRLNMGKWPKMYNGNDIEYSIQEVGNLTAYYTTSASVIMPTGDPRKFDIVLTNTHEPDSIEIKAIKIWKDNGNASGKRTHTVVQLYRSSGMSNSMFVPASIPAEGNANWFPYGPTREISTSDKDTLVWKVPKFDNGVAYRYAVREFDVPEGYRTTYTSSGIMNNNQVTITNEYLPPVNVTLTAQKKIRGRNWFNDDHFTFALKPQSTNNPMPANSINHNGVLQSRTQVTYDSTYISDSVRAVTFAPITFRLEDMGKSRTKTFKYVIQELTPDEAGETRIMGITYSTIPYYADIIVQKGANDSLITSVNYYYLTPNDNQTQDEDQTISQNVDTPMVVNVYNPSSFLFRPIANKSFINASTNAISLIDSMFSFKLSPVGANAAKAPMPSGTQGTLDERYYIAGNTGNSVYFFKGEEDGLLFDHIDLRAHFTDSQLAEGVTFEYRIEEIVPDNADTLDNGIMRLTSNDYISYYDALVHFFQLDVKLDENDSLTFINNPNPSLREFYVKPGGDTVFVERGTEFSLLHHNDGIPVFRNSRIGLTTLRVSKNWVDYNNSLQLRPEQIIVKLLADGDSVNVASLNGTNNWSYNFTKLPFANITDTYEIDTIQYTVEEVPIPNYMSLYNFVSNGVGVINTLDSNIVKRDTNITVRKNWIAPDDTEYPDIIFYLLQDNVKIDSVILHEGTLTHTFTNLPYYDVYENGKVIVDNSTLRKFNYMIDERPVTGFSTQINNAEGEITNTILQDYTSVSGEKSWIDPAGTFHPTVTIVLERDGDSVNFVRLENGITHYAFNNLPVYDLTVNGEPIVEGDGHRFEYSVRELPVNGYSSEKDGNDFVNTINQAYIDIPVSKIWNDRSNQDGYRPESVTMKLTGTTNLPYSQEYTLDITGEGNTWDSVFRNLPKYDQARNVITYTLSEPNTPQHYTQSVNGYSITNTHRPDSVLVHVSKIWNDHLNNDAYRPNGSITLHLMVGDSTLQSRTMEGTGHEWEVSFGKWPRRSNGMDIAYTVIEDEIAHYTASDAIRVETNDVTHYNLQITNTHVLDSIRPIVNKSWEVPTGLETSDIAPAQLTLYRTSQLNVPFDPHSENWTQIGTIAVPFSSTTVQIDFGKQPKFNKTAQYRYYVHESHLDAGFEAIYGNNGELKPIGNTDTITENINNRYIMPTTIVLPLKKILLGRAWQETDTFEMALIPQGDAPMPVDDIDVEGIPYGSLIITADSLNHGGHDSLRIGTFPPVIFKLEDMGGTNEKVFLYHIRELNSGESGHPRLPGVSYSSQLYHVNITVRKVGLSLQIHSVSITETHSHTDADTAVITNHFNNIQTDFILKAEKELTTQGIHQTLSDGDYHFVLRPVGENAAKAPMPNGTEGVGTNRHFSVPNEGHLVEFEGTDNKGILFEYDNLLTLFDENALLEGITFYYEISEEIPTDATLNDDGSYTRSRTVLNEEGLMVDETYDAVSHVRPVTVRKITVDGQDILEVTAGNCASHHYENDNTIDIGTHRHGTGGVPIFHNLLKAKVSVTVEKRWDDWHNALETRPNSVSVTLLANGVETDSVAVLNADNNWRYDFHNLTVTDANGVINYTVREDSVSHYEATYSGDMEEGLIILNTLTTYGGDDDCGILVERDQLSECPEIDCTPVTDADGNTYSTIKLDGYCWMAENLRTMTPNAMVYRSALSPDTVANLATYGRLYTWYDAAGGTNPEPIDGYVRGVCPNGWHLPTAKEINVLMTNSSDALRSESYWAIPADGANSTGFNALPAGYYNAAAQRFEGLHSTTLFHGDTPSSLFSLEYYCCKILPDQQTLQNGYSVRCVKDCE